jgi:sporulation protein YlmC with PRC-barrel domain
MRTFSRPVLAFSLVLASGVALPAFAQTPSAGNATTAPATHEIKPPANATSPSQRNTVLTDSGDVRASKLVGAAVYNDRDEKIGSVDDLVLGKDNKADDVIVLGQNHRERYDRAEALARFRLERGSPSTTRNCISADVNPICWTVQGRKVVAVPL